eukprot:gene24508-31914_t
MPTIFPSNSPSCCPTIYPSVLPSTVPTEEPVTAPSNAPSCCPSYSPSQIPTTQPVVLPSSMPTMQPTFMPWRKPTKQPFCHPTVHPITKPSNNPSALPTHQPIQSDPSIYPTTFPSYRPSIQPSSIPSVQPTLRPSTDPTRNPYKPPTCVPSTQPQGFPSRKPWNRPSHQPTNKPTRFPSHRPRHDPSQQPRRRPSAQPIRKPSRQPAYKPSLQPSRQPILLPTAKPSVETVSFTTTMYVTNITREEISNNTYISAFTVAVAQSMEIDSSYVVYETFSALRRRLADSGFELVFQINVPISSLNSSTVIFNATFTELAYLSKYYKAVDAGHTLQYAKQQLLNNGISGAFLTFLILPFRSLSQSPTCLPSVSSSASSSSNSNFTTQLAAIVVGAFVAIICMGVSFVVYRRRTVSSNVSRKYKPISTPVVDEEMSMGNIYSPDREDGIFSLDIQNLRLMQHGEEHKASENPGSAAHSPTPPPSVAITVKNEEVYDTSAVVAIDNSVDLSFGSATAAVVSFLEGKGWNRKKPAKVDEEADMSFDSLYPENKPIAFSQFGPGHERRANRDDKSQLNFHDVYPDRSSEDIDSSAKMFDRRGNFSSPSQNDTQPKKFGSKLPTPVDKANVSGFNPMRRTPSKDGNKGSATSQREQLKKPAVDSNNAYRDQIIESRKQLRRLDPAAVGSNPLSYQASKSSAMKANAAKFADPVLSSSIAATKKKNGNIGSSNITDPPRRHDVPIVDVFKSVNVAQMSGISPGIKFRLSKLKFEARSGDK